MRYVATLFKPVGRLPDWSRNAYSPRYADRFAANVKRWAPDAEVVIVTDYDPGEFKAGQTVLPFQLPDRGWCCLLEMFRPDVVGEAAILCGLDTIFIGPLADVERVTRDTGYTAVSDPYHEHIISNALVGVTAPCAREIWEAWLLARAAGAITSPVYRIPAAPAVFSEMAWLREHFPVERKSRFDSLLPTESALLSYKARVAPRAGPPTGAAVYFHGEPKPHDLADLGERWVLDNWGPPLDQSLPEGAGLDVPRVAGWLRSRNWRVSTAGDTALRDELRALGVPGVTSVDPVVSPVDVVVTRMPPSTSWSQGAVRFVLEATGADVARLVGVGATINSREGRVVSGWFASKPVVRFETHGSEPQARGPLLTIPSHMAPPLAAQAVAAWLDRFPRPLTFAQIVYEGEAAEDTAAAVQNEALLAMTLATASHAELEQMEKNIAANLAEMRGTPRAGANLLGEAFGRTVHVCGAGPSLDMALLDQALLDQLGMQWGVDRIADRKVFDTVFTLEMRPEKLGCLESYERAVVAHIASHPERVKPVLDCRGTVVWVRSTDPHRDVPDWLPAIKRCPTVLVMAVRCAIMARAKKIVLHGADSALLDGQMYSDPDAKVHAMHGGTADRVLVEAIGGGLVESTPPMVAQIVALEACAAEAAALGIECVNATTRGAKLPGWRHP